MCSCRKPLIAILDDEEALGSILAAEIQSLGFMVIASENKAEFIEELGRVTPDLIISDLNSPGMDGLTFLSELRATRGSSQYP